MTDRENDAGRPDDVDEELDEVADERWADESPASDPRPELIHEDDPDDSPDQPNDEA